MTRVFPPGKNFKRCRTCRQLSRDAYNERKKASR